MAIELIDRKESASYKGSIYELTLLWDRESIRKCFCGMPPFFAHIRKDGANFATIDCYSNDNGRFAVKKFMPSLLARPDWQVRFDKDINTIPLLELLAGRRFNLYGFINKKARKYERNRTFQGDYQGLS